MILNDKNCINFVKKKSKFNEATEKLYKLV